MSDHPDLPRVFYFKGKLWAWDHIDWEGLPTDSSGRLVMRAKELKTVRPEPRSKGAKS